MESTPEIEFLSEKKSPGVLRLNMVPAKRQKVKTLNVDLNKIPACGLTARGLKLSQKPVQNAELLPEIVKAPKSAAPVKPAPKSGFLAKAEVAAKAASKKKPVQSAKKRRK